MLLYTSLLVFFAHYISRKGYSISAMFESVSPREFCDVSFRVFQRDGKFRKWFKIFLFQRMKFDSLDCQKVKSPRSREAVLHVDAVSKNLVDRQTKWKKSINFAPDCEENTIFSNTEG